MLKNWADKIKTSEKHILNQINGYGMLLRFILPLMVALLGWSLNMNINDIKKNQVEVREDLKIFQTETRIYSQNHLEHHRSNEVKIEGRLARIETELKRLK